MHATSASDVERDIDHILWSMQLCGVYRYNGQAFWEHETATHVNALSIDGVDRNGDKIPRSESVADHSWHMADMALLLAPKFPQLDVGRCVMLAVLHDKLEIVTGDYDPLGKDGTGTDAHAFNADKKREKDEAERAALDLYLARTNSASRTIQQDVLAEALDLTSPESRFVKALDRIQPIAYILMRKNGQMSDNHLIFTLKYTSTYVHHYPDLFPYYDGLIKRLIRSIADHRQVDENTIHSFCSGLRADDTDQPMHSVEA